MEPPEKQQITWNASDYHANSRNQQIWAQELIQKLRLTGDEHILDIGCGDGKVTAELACRVVKGSVTGIDSSTGMISYAKEHYLQTSYPNLSFIQMDARHLLFENTFDRVFSNAVLHWISDPRPVLAGIERSLRPGGAMLVQVGGKGNVNQVASLLEVLIHESHWHQYFEDFSFPYYFYGIEEYREWFSGFSLIPVRIELIPKDMAFATRDEFAGWFRTTWHPYLQRIPSDLHTVFIASLIELYVSSYPADEKGVIHVDGVRLELEAKRTQVP